MCGINNENFIINESSGDLEFDLKHEFGLANRMYFNNELQTIPLAYKKLTNALGRVKVRQSKRGTRIMTANITVLEITTRYNLTRDQFLSTFLHELCHVKMLQDPSKYLWSGGYHGQEWLTIAARISKKSGIEITKDETTASFDTKDEDSEYVVIMPYSKDGNEIAGVAFTSSSIWNRRKESWELLLKARFPESKIVIFATKDGRVHNVASKSNANAKFYHIDSDFAKDILKGDKNKILKIIN